ncbi:MAG: hypothetical protein ACHQQQ_02960 [Bacteroidota bacterium]
MIRLHTQRQIVLFITLFFIVGLLHVFGQPTGSPYTRYGIGDINYFPNSSALGMGGAGVAGSAINSVDLMNPALWTRIAVTRLSIGASFRGLTTTDASGSARYGNLNFNDAMLAIPLSAPNGVVIAFGLSQYSTIGYTIQQENNQTGYDYTLVNHGEGGVSQAHFGVSVNAGSDLHVGAKYNYYFGTIQHNISQNLSNSLYSNYSVERLLQLKGSGATIGAVYSGLTNLLHLESSKLNIGATFTMTSYLKADLENYASSSNGSNTTFDTSQISEPKLKLPFMFTTGLSYLTDHFIVATDIAIQNWNDPSVVGVLIPTLRNTYRWSFGGEFTPKREQSSPYFQRVAYRLGTFYHATYYVINDQPVNELGFTGGMSMPLQGDSRLIIAGEYGTRGATDYGLQKERFFRLTLSFNVSELWFVRPPEE